MVAQDAALAAVVHSYLQLPLKSQSVECSDNKIRIFYYLKHIIHSLDYVPSKSKSSTSSTDPYDYYKAPRGLLIDLDSNFTNWISITKRRKTEKKTKAKIFLPLGCLCHDFLFTRYRRNMIRQTCKRVMQKGRLYGG